MKRSIWVGLGAFIVALGLATGLGEGQARGATTQPREMTFIDGRSGLALRLQVEANAPRAGAFVFRRPDGLVYEGTVGTRLRCSLTRCPASPDGLVYEGTVGTAMRVHSPASITVNYTGAATLRADRSLVAAINAEDDPQAVIVTLQAQIDPKRYTAEATLTAGTERFHLVVREASRGGLDTTLRGFEDATRAADWVALYGYMNSDIARANALAAFTARMAQGESAQGPVISLRRLSLGPVQVDDQGATFVVVGYEITRRAPSGQTTTERYDARFLREGEDWKLWYMDER